MDISSESSGKGFGAWSHLACNVMLAFVGTYWLGLVVPIIHLLITFGIAVIEHLFMDLVDFKVLKLPNLSGLKANNG